VEFEVVSSLELENINIPRKSILSTYCPFAYRGDCCGYSSDLLLYDANNTPLTVIANKGKWESGKAYVVGDAVFMFTMTKMNIVPNEALSNANNHEFPEYAKAWFVCKSNHTSSVSTEPTKREDLWSRDACQKTLKACKLRFGNVIRFGGFPGTDGFGV
jgi:phage-related protein